METHPIRCGCMFPLQIALALGQVAHATLRPNIKGGMGFVAILGKTAKIHPKVVKRKIVSPYHKRDKPRAIALMQTEALPPFCDKGWGSRR